MAPAPLVSVVVPAYNAGTFLAECLDSLVTQSLTDREILVMDDASTDATAEIATRYAPAVTLVRQAHNLGQFANVEAGLRLARGAYVAVFHADDRYEPTILAEEVAVLESNPAVGVVFALDRFIDAHGREYGRLTLPAAVRGRGVLDHAEVLNGVLTHKNVFMPTPGAMVRASLYDRIGGFRSEFGSAADLDMWLRLSELAKVAILERHLFAYRHTVSSEGQSYQRLRTTPELHFALMDERLAGDAADLVTPAARRAHEAHRAVDRLRIAVNAYILGDRDGARTLWREVSLGALLGSGAIRRPRHLVLWLLLGGLGGLPHLAPVARMLDWRYYRRLPWWQATT